MNRAADHDDRYGDVDRQASAWLVQLDDDPDNGALRAEFESWLAASPRHEAAWRESLTVAGILAVVGPSLGIGKIVPLRHAGPSRLSRLFDWRAVAAIAAAACLAWIAIPGLAIRLQADQVAGTAEIRPVNLADGSKAYLAPGAAMAFDMDGKSRSFRLLRGEAFFEVARDPLRSFRVIAGGGEVTVLGTAFEVGLRNDHATVSVRRGLVQVAYPTGSPPVRERLRPGETIELRWVGASRRGKIRPDRIAAWLHGKAIVNDRPLGEIIDELRPWYRGLIIAQGTGLQQRRVTGIYDLRDPDAALAALAKAHDLTVRELSPWLRIVTVN